VAVMVNVGLSRDLAERGLQLDARLKRGGRSKSNYIRLFGVDCRCSPAKQSKNGEVSSEIGGGGRRCRLVTVGEENS
jgi:hypothetical protein